jgi:hypothetical protein
MSFQRDSSSATASYRSYLVRLWQEQPHTEWRGSIQSVQTGATVRFGALEQLLAFLVAQTAEIEMPVAPDDRQNLGR